MQFILKNNLNKGEIAIEVRDKMDSNLFFHFDVVLPEGLEDGEYTYTLKDGDKVVSRGLCQIGDYIPEKTTYTTENNGYKTYNG